MQKLVFVNGAGGQIDLTGGDFGITEWEGFSADDLNIQSQQVPFQDGAVFLDALMEQRELSVTVAMQDENNLEKRYRLRRQMIATMNPKLGEGLLIYTNDFLSKQIHVIPQIPLFQNKNSNDSGTPKVSCSFTACNPYWEDLEDTEISFDITQQPILKNEGDIPTQLKMDWITGGVQNGSVTNLTTGKKIKYEGELTDSLEINTNVGNKSVVSKIMGWEISSILVEYNWLAYSEKLNTICCVCDNGIILTSSDGITWTSRTSGITSHLYGVYYSDEKELFIAVGPSGTILTSPDAITWTSRTSGVSVILYNAGYSTTLDLFVIVGESGTILTSPDAITWTQRTGGTSENLMDVIYAKNQFVIVGISGTILTSSDGITWTSRTSGTSNGVTAITYSETLDLFIAVGHSGTILTSPDAITWTSRTSGITSHLYGVYYSDEKELFIAVGHSGTILTSPNGINWVSKTSGVTSTLRGIVYADDIGLFVIAGYYSQISGIQWITQNAVILTSIDTDNWTKYVNDVRTNNTGVAYSEKLKLYVRVKSGDFNIYISSDCKNWEGINIGHGSEGIIYIKDFDSFFTKGNYVYKSSDGINWTSQGFACKDIAYLKANGIAWSCRDGNYWYNTRDGINWNQRLGSTISANGICASEKLRLFVAVGNRGNIFINDGGWTDTWSSVTSGVSTALNSVVYSETLGLFVAVGASGVILTSKDGTTWNTVTSGVSTALKKVIYSEAFGIFIAVGASGVILTSSDGVTWYRRQEEITNNFNDVCATLDMIIVVGDINVILLSQFDEEENRIQYLSPDSDIGLNLAIGDNKFMINKSSGNMIVRIKYRQKYIGV